MDSAVNGNIEGSVKRARLDSTAPWIDHLSQSLNSVQAAQRLQQQQQEAVIVKLLCGADLLESFGKPGVWKPEDVSSEGTHAAYGTCLL